MSKYFTKYLPVEGEIKESPHIWFNDKVWVHQPILSNYRDKTFVIPLGEKQGIHALLSDCKPAKLFLCTRNIQVGDELTSIKGSLKGRVEDEVQLRDIHENGIWFKVIGEISPDALSYVKEGDEVNKKDLILIEYPKGFKYKDLWAEWDWKDLDKLLKNKKFGSEILINFKQ